MRRIPLPLFVLLCASACGFYDVDIDWTIDGEAPGSVCPNVQGSDVTFQITSRDHADPRFAGPVTTTTVVAPCTDGSATLQTGPFAEIVATIEDGDVTIAAAPAVNVAPGGPNVGGFTGDAPRALVDLTLLQGKVTATLIVAGKSCADAGASSFTATLLEQTQSQVLVPVDGAVDVTVPCSGNAVFEHSPVKVGVPHFIQARATVGATTFITSSAGEGFTTRGANTVVTIDTQAQ